MSNSDKPDSKPKAPTVESQPRSNAASIETKRPTDSVPAISGSFANLPVRFGRYQVEKLLGRGGMGSVYLARDTQLNRLVALKIPKVSASGSKRLLLRLETEAKAAAQLDHPSLCKVFDAGEVEGHCFIAMQYIEGETLKSQLEVKRKSVKEAVALILQLAEGLLEAHELGIVHRDLKPENIMINRRGIPVIMDFGLAKFSNISSNASQTQAGTILGSPAYMSPEQASGNVREIDQRSDIYALGVILFELLTGKWPFTGSAMQILGQKSVLEPTSPLKLNPRVPPKLAAICHKMIAKTNAERYQNLNEVIDDLAAIDLSLALPVVPEASLAEAHPFTFSGFIITGQPEEQLASIAKRQKRKSSTVSAFLYLALATQITQLGASWKKQSPMMKWTVLGGTGVISLVLGVILYFSTNYGVVRIDIDDPSLSARFDGNYVTVDNDGKPIRVTPTAKHTLEVLQDGVVIESPVKELTLQRGEKRIVKITLLDGDVVIDGKHIFKPMYVASLDEKREAVKESQGKDEAKAPAAAIAPFDSVQANAHQEAWAKYLGRKVVERNSVGMDLVLVPPGKFQMGSRRAENDRGGDENLVAVVLTKPFQVSRTEVTQSQWFAVMATDPWKGGDRTQLGADYAATYVTWEDAEAFCTKLSLNEGANYRLTTEAEWEYVCRAGTETSFSFGDDVAQLDDFGWWGGIAGDGSAKSEPYTHQVGLKSPNPWGLYDVHGNVWELCSDWYDERLAGGRDPIGPPSGTRRILRGGSWYYLTWCCRSAARRARERGYTDNTVGFRVVREIKKPTDSATAISEDM